MTSELIKVCSRSPRPSLQNNHSKGHQYWARDVWHTSITGSGKTACGRDCSDYIRIDQFEESDIDDFHLCSRCKKALT